MISTRGRYAVRIMIDLAEHRGNGYIPLKEIAKRQEISLKYIEKFVPELSRAGLVESIHGKGGGYRLCRNPEDYNIGEILRLTEGDMAPVACLCDGSEPCPRVSECKTLPMWRDYYKMTLDYLRGVKLSDLVGTPTGGDYVI